MSPTGVAHIMNGIAVLDAGGQYCHLLARRIRELHVQSHVLPIGTSAEVLDGVSGIIISGGPRSVTEAESPRINPSIFDLDVPVLGICYGHQLLAATLPGGAVTPSSSREYGTARLRLASANVNSILSQVPETTTVWMSHGDSVERLPRGFQLLASTDECHVAAMANPERRIFGVQFHPEVSHSEHGQTVLRNFVKDVCRCDSDWHPSSDETIRDIKADIVARVGPLRKVLFFVSGGVDSTVAFKLCVDALGRDRVHGVFVDTGFMRQDEPREVMQAFECAGFYRVEKREAANRFLPAVSKLHDPEEKRKAIGLTFLAVENEVLASVPPDEWMLGQGTIYPDTIESGGSREAALIKTHHNRVPELTKRIEAGLVVEPLAQFYKDEVRQIGRALGLPGVLIEKQPFPGPGLAVRYLCSEQSLPWHDPDGLDDVARRYGMHGRALPLRAVGVQGDGRTYAHVAVLVGDYRSDVIGTVSKEITNTVRDVNRVAYWIAGKAGPDGFRVEPESIASDGLSLLKSADAIVRDVLAHDSGGARIWQCPVILLPLKYQGLRTVAIRPVESVDGMTAQYAKLPKRVLMSLAGELLTLSGIGAVLYDVTNKPPATIEWE